MIKTQPAPSSGRTADTSLPATRGVRRSARVGGAALLVLAVLSGAANFGVIQRLVTPGDASRTAQHILGAAGLFRLAIAALLVVAILDIVVACALRVFFAPVHRGLATLAAGLRIGYAAIFAVAISQLTGVLPLLSHARDLTMFSAGQRRTEALTKIGDFADIWHAGLILFGLHLVLIGYLAGKSGYVPRVLGVLLAVAGGGYLVGSFSGLLVAGYSGNVSAVTFIGEALFTLWLLVKGRNTALRIQPISSATA